MRKVLLLLLLLTQAAHAGEGAKRVALVIGNGEYRSVERLGNPVNDARLMGETLASLGFTLIGGAPHTNLDKAGLARAVHEFGRAIAGADVALFYYSGHGLQVQGVNWLVPVDANPTRPQDLDYQMLDADAVLRQMQGAGTRLNIVILDACRNNPFTVRGVRSAGGGLAEMRAPEGTLISYATQPGNVARDGDGANSPFTQALTQTMRQPGLDIFRAFNQVGLQVKRATGGEQQPWVSSSPIDGEFAFNGGGDLPAAPMPPALPTPAPPPRGIRPALPRPALPRPALPRPALPRQERPSIARAPASRPAHCAELAERFQLGEPLSQAERSALSVSCRI